MHAEREETDGLCELSYRRVRWSDRGIGGANGMAGQSITCSNGGVRAVRGVICDNICQALGVGSQTTRSGPGQVHEKKALHLRTELIGITLFGMDAPSGNPAALLTTSG